MIKSLTKAMIGKNKTKKIIEHSHEDEWIIGVYDNTKLLSETDDKTKSVPNAKSLPIISPTSTNKDTIAQNFIDTPF